MIEIDTSQLDALNKRFQGAKAVVEKGSFETLKMATLMLQGKAKELAPVDKSTLRKSILATNDAFQGIVGSNLEYAKYQEFGTGIYGPKGSPIVPKRAKMLAWQGKSGQWFRARSVKGSKPVKFLQGGLEYLKQNMDKVLDYAAKMILKNL